MISRKTLKRRRAPSWSTSLRIRNHDRHMQNEKETGLDGARVNNIRATCFSSGQRCKVSYWCRRRLYKKEFLSHRNLECKNSKCTRKCRAAGARARKVYMRHHRHSGIKNKKQGEMIANMGQQLYYSGDDKKHDKGTAFIVYTNKMNPVLYSTTQSENRLISIRLNTKPITTVIQVYALTSTSSEEAVDDLYARLNEEIAQTPKKDILVVIC